MMSMLIGTAFGTAATMGIICMSIGRAINANELLIGGAVLAGSYFGDRCSPMSTSAMLVSQLTDTNLSKNIGRMLRTSVVPFIIACLIYVAWDTFMGGSGTVPDVTSILSRAFRLSWVALAPAIHRRPPLAHGAYRAGKAPCADTGGVRAPARLRHLYLCSACSHPGAPSDPAFWSTSPGSYRRQHGQWRRSVLDAECGIYRSYFFKLRRSFPKHASASTYVRDGR